MCLEIDSSIASIGSFLYFFDVLFVMEFFKKMYFLYCKNQEEKEIRILSCIKKSQFYWFAFPRGFQILGEKN
jgi:hypothetical protein